MHFIIVALPSLYIYMYIYSKNETNKREKKNTHKKYRGNNKFYQHTKTAYSKSAMG